MYDFENLSDLELEVLADMGDDVEMMMAKEEIANRDEDWDFDERGDDDKDF